MFETYHDHPALILMLGFLNCISKTLWTRFRLTGTPRGQPTVAIRELAARRKAHARQSEVHACTLDRMSRLGLEPWRCGS
jgi:hypothetical protein